MTLAPHILRKSLLVGARQAQGVAVVIDVLRAFTSAAYMTHLGATHIVLVNDPQVVLRLKREMGYLAVGEVGGRPVDGFDLGNSPAAILAAGRDLFAGRVVAQRTSAGVAGAVAASHQADRVLLGSYVTAAATAHHIQCLASLPQTVSLVAMGDAGRARTPDDERCADYLEHLLTGCGYDHAQAVREIVEHPCTQKFLRGDQAHYPPEDPIYCLQVDLFDFALVASLEDGQLVARRTDLLPGVAP
ncbi:MAG: 2-phosphosulfolactate phosphatase [Anaerolineae bacterium]|jgi:2-phosphosulfolactate phosphatase